MKTTKLKERQRHRNRLPEQESISNSIKFDSSAGPVSKFSHLLGFRNHVVLVVQLIH
jgi:hypothetical protein